MPFLSSRRVRNIRPCAFSSEVSAISMSIACAPCAVRSFRVSRRMAWAGYRRLADNTSTTKSQAAFWAARPQAILMSERSMLGRQAWWCAVRPQLRSHATLDAHAPADMHDLIGSQFGEAEAPQRLHVHEDIRGAF